MGWPPVHHDFWDQHTKDGLSFHVSIQWSCPKLFKLRVVIWSELGNFSLSLGNCRKKRGDTEGIPWWSSGSTLQAMGSIPSWGTKILHATEYSQKKKKKETQKLEIVRQNPLIEGPKENIHKLLLKLYELQWPFWDTVLINTRSG